MLRGGTRFIVMTLVSYALVGCGAVAFRQPAPPLLKEQEASKGAVDATSDSVKEAAPESVDGKTNPPPSQDQPIESKPILQPEDKAPQPTPDMTSNPAKPNPKTPTPKPDDGLTPPPKISDCKGTRGMWVWDFGQTLASEATQEELISSSSRSGITDLFVYLGPRDYVTKKDLLKAFNSKASKVGLKIWGLDGWRGFFADAQGPKGLYDSADALIAFNSQVAANERFHGFHSDMEPQGGQGAEFPNSFHDELKDSQLNTQSGGVWQLTQALDREMLLRNWLDIHAEIKSRMQKAGLLLGAAMPSWVDDYFGEEVKVTYKGKREGVHKAMMEIVDDYLIMSYRTDVTRVYDIIKGELTYADSLPAAKRPRIYAGLETHKNVGAAVSYGDKAGNDSRSHVLAEIGRIHELAKAHPSLCGVNIHDWVGWRGLKN